MPPVDDGNKYFVANIMQDELDRIDDSDDDTTTSGGDDVAKEEKKDTVTKTIEDMTLKEFQKAIDKETKTKKSKNGQKERMRRKNEPLKCDVQCVPVCCYPEPVCRDPEANVQCPADPITVPTIDSQFPEVPTIDVKYKVNRFNRGNKSMRRREAVKFAQN